MKPNDFLAFVQISSMWSLQHIIELMDAPRYLTPETQFNGKPLIVYFAKTVWRLLEICIMEHLCDIILLHLCDIMMTLKSSARNSPIIQVEKGPPVIGWHHMKNELHDLDLELALLLNMLPQRLLLGTLLQLFPHLKKCHN